MNQQLTKRELASRARLFLSIAKQYKACGNYYAASRYTEQAASLTKELHRRIFADRLTALVVAFPKRISFGA